MRYFHLIPRKTFIIFYLIGVIPCLFLILSTVGEGFDRGNNLLMFLFTCSTLTLLRYLVKR